MGLGMPEVILILVIALIVFGPRKLPELGKSLGQAMSQFRRASEDFKRTWEQEVDLEKTKTGTTTAALGSANPDASGYSSDYYSYGYEPEYGSGESTTTPSGTTTPGSDTATPTASSGTPTGTPTGTPNGSPNGSEVKSEAATNTPEKSHWI
jgi:sec-independent protein translocase protein TatA